VRISLQQHGITVGPRACPRFLGQSTVAKSTEDKRNQTVPPSLKTLLLLEKANRAQYHQMGGVNLGPLSEAKLKRIARAIQIRPQ
jgi:hypothetical protein